MKQVYLQRSLLIGISVLVAISFSEISLRLIDKVYPFMHRFDLVLSTTVYSAHPFLNHTLTPNLAMTRQGVPEWEMPTYVLETNELGFRFKIDRFAVPKPKNVFRIAVLGDSQIEGYRLEESLPYLLEKKLAPVSVGKKLEVMNFGVLSYSTIIHYVNLKRTVLRFQPDLVIVHFDMTDVFDDNVRYRDITEWDKYGKPVSVQPGIEYSSVNTAGKAESTMQVGKRIALESPLDSPGALTIWLIERSDLFKALYYKMHTAEEVFNLYDSLYLKAHALAQSRADTIDLTKIHAWCRNYDDPGIQKHVEFSLSILGHISRLLKTEHIPFVLITLPIKEQLVSVNGNDVLTKKPLERLRRYCNQNKIYYHSPQNELVAALEKKIEVYNRDNMHLIGAGQQIWADALAAYLAPRIQWRPHAPE